MYEPACTIHTCTMYVCCLFSHLQAIGFTLLYPDTIDPVPNVTPEVIDSENYWLFKDNMVYHNRNRQRQSISTGHLNKDDSIGCCITTGGDLEIHINGKRVVGWCNVPVDKPLWGVVDMCGRAKTVQSQFHCGELYSV